MTNPTSNFGWQMPTASDLVTDLPADFETFGQAVDTSLADLKGGTSGQVLSKASNTDMDFTWVTSDDANAIQNAIVDAKGDLIAASAADTPARLAVGANGHVLTADSSTATGLKWSPAGKVLQVISARSNSFTSNSTSTYADTSLSATITPTSATSKILIFASHVIEKTAGNANNGMNLRLVRNSTELTVFSVYNLYSGTAIQLVGSASVNYLDSPATTSAITYKTQFMNPNNTAAVNVQPNSSESYITLMEIGA